MSKAGSPPITDKEAIEANIAVHTAVSHRYNQSPHFREENREKVRTLLSTLRERLRTAGDRKRLLDMGCGTGFILSIAHPFFDELHGIDVTDAMIKQVDLSPGNIKTHISPAEKTPFAEGHFDFVTAYSFMDHLADIGPFLAEVYRVLKPGGIFYADLNPNRAYWDYLFNLDAGGVPDAGPADSFSPVVRREIENVVHNDALLAAETGLSESLIAACESTKQYRRGFSRAEFGSLAKSLGFRKSEFTLDWFMGQGPVMHQVSFEAARTVDTFLRQISPASDHLFKYLRVVLEK
ncbi:MAG TPA: class I SAM-dependent methyltransferase [Bdellovibrionota bacterium]|nr:class I SAM-dependent methyltransferase [Bdellovibrionota bacterium]